MSTVAKPNICTWIFLEQKGDESYYPQVGGSSSDQKFQDVYWKCVCTFFATSKRLNPEANHVLFSNVEPASYPVVEGVNVLSFLQELGVKPIVLPISYLPPKDYFRAWRNQFYIFDIIEYFSKQGENGQKHLVLDSDCLWTQSADEIWSIMDEHPWPNYIYHYEPDHSVNNLTRKMMREIFAELSGREVKELPHYSGGEILAATTEAMQGILDSFLKVWPVLLKRHQQDLPKLNEEAHVLSYLHHLNGRKGENALAGQIKRIWTFEDNYNNVEADDFSLPIWHLPGEKREGISLIFNRVKNSTSEFWTMPVEELRDMMAPLVGIRKRKVSMSDKVYKYSNKLKNKVDKLL